MARWSQSQLGPLVPPGDIQHSTLEVYHRPWLENDSRAAPIVDHGAQNEKIIHYNDVGKQVVDLDPDKQAVIDASDALPEVSRPTEQRKILGLRHKTCFVLLAAVLMLIIAGSVAGLIVGRTAAHRPSPTTSGTPTTSRTPTATRVPYVNTGLAAMQWMDLDHTRHQRLYYQDNAGRIRESAWNSDTDFLAAWEVNTISDIVEPATPLAAAAVYPFASIQSSIVKNVYYISTDNKIIGRQGQINDSQAWKDNDFSRLYTGSNSTFLGAYSYQHIQTLSQELVVLFQDKKCGNCITQSHHNSNISVSNPWITNSFNFSPPEGSAFAISRVSYLDSELLMLYTVDDKKILQQHEYKISSTGSDPRSVILPISGSATGLTVEPQSPLTVVAQDNQWLHKSDASAPCMDSTPITHLIFFAVPDRSSLVLSVWNCTSGFSDHTSEIAPLQKPNTTFLSLETIRDPETWDALVYIMFDSGSGPQVEEWAVPKIAGLPWVTSRSVTVDFQL